nr:MAG TPA: transmembrane protein [Caudoviricetes sp.]
MKKVIAIVFLVLGIALVVLGAVGSATRAISGEATISFILIGVGVIIFAAASCLKYENESEGCDRKNDRPVLRAQNESRNVQSNGRPVYYLPPDKSENEAIKVQMCYEALMKSKDSAGMSVYARMYFIALFCLCEELKNNAITLLEISTGVLAIGDGYVFDGKGLVPIGFVPLSDEDYLCALTIQILVLAYKKYRRTPTFAAVAQALCSADTIKRAIRGAKELGEEVRIEEMEVWVNDMLADSEIVRLILDYENEVRAYIARRNSRNN